MEECGGTQRDLTGLAISTSNSFRIRLFRNIHLNGYDLYYWFSVESKSPLFPMLRRENLAY